ncbi:MAG: hypothetical protein U1A72_20860 [Sulfuritalea sp.]|nr:hypothetical protein [Sulfuritalea sp.]
MKIKWLWMWVGGSITRVAGTGLVVGLFIVAYGATPGQALADLLTALPPWLTNPWFKLALVVVGLALIGVSVHFNVWSLRQQAIDELAEDLSCAISDLLNKPVANEAEVAQWEADFRTWCQRVSARLENRAFFTRADQLHFDMLGFVPPTNFAGSFNQRHEWVVSQLNVKFERLRDVINWTQMRSR